MHASLSWTGVWWLPKLLPQKKTQDSFLAFGLDLVTKQDSDVSLAAWLEARLDTTLGHQPDQGGHQGLPGNSQPQPGNTVVDAAVITRAVGQGVALGYQHLVTQQGNTPASPGGDKASKVGDSTYSRDDVCTVMAFSGIEDPQDCQVMWTIFAEKKKNVEACRRYLMKGMTDYAYNCRILIDGGIYIEQDTMKSILELRFNPGEGIVYVQSAAKGLSLLCCCSRSNNETEEIKERELALNATEQTRQFEDYVKYVRERLRTSQQAIIGTSTAESPGQSSTMADRFSTWSSTNRTLTVVGPYLSLSLFRWVSWRMYGSATQSSGGIS